MRVFDGFEQATNIVKPVVTLGSYDGVHRGHREILSHIRSLAKERDGESVVVTFHPHPRLVLGADHSLRLLNTLPEKLELLETAGIDNVIVAPFTEAFSLLSAETFVREYLTGKLHTDTLMVGYNHHLGHNQDGNPHSLEHLAQTFGFRLEAMPQQRLGGEKISSTVIRSLVAAGQMDQAARYLGAPYPLSGTLTPEGILTGIDPVKLLPPEGCYPVTVHIAGPAEDAGLPDWFTATATSIERTTEPSGESAGSSARIPEYLSAEGKTAAVGTKSGQKIRCEAIISMKRTVRIIPGGSLSNASSTELFKALSELQSATSPNIRVEFK